MRHIKAILFDLDGTLLDSQMSTLLPPYLELLSQRMAHLVPPQQFIRDLLAATEAMAANDGSRTNAQRFAEVFFPRVGRTPEELMPVFEAFYAHDFGALQVHTRRKPEARPVVRWAFERGYAVAVATNPLFPETAVRQRLAWGRVDDFPYRHITTYENSSFCKPHPGYFAGIADRLGVAPEECLMVGDEAMDMAAAALGCTTYLVPGPSTHLGPGASKPDYRGPLEGVPLLLDGMGRGSAAP